MSISVDSDNLTVTFYQNSTGKGPSVDDIINVSLGEGQQFVTQIDNITSYTIDSDFFVPSDGFHITMEDDRIENLYKAIQIGNFVDIKINGYSQLNGFVDKIDLSYTRSGGKQLTIIGRDILGVMNDAVCRQNLTATATTPISTIFEQLFADFGITNLSLDDSTQLSAATGGKVGIKIKGKTFKARAQSFSKAILHQVRPYPEERYMQYILRLCKELGLNVKLTPGSQTVNIQPPVYDRGFSNLPGRPLFTLMHSDDPNDPNPDNNVLSGRLSLDWSKQPSVIITEMTYATQPVFNKNAYKIVMINEITGYQPGISAENLTQANAIPNVQSAIKNYCAGGTVSNQQNNGSAYLLSPNTSLYNVLNNLNLLQQINVGTISRPKFAYDEKASTVEEAIFYTQRIMSEAQNEFLKLEYEVFGHSQLVDDGNGGSKRLIWQPNMMVRVNDQVLLPGLNINFWIQRRTFTKSRSGGTKTKLELRLPYTFIFDVSK